MKVYIVPLTKHSPKSGMQRFSAYRHTSEGLEIIWPEHPEGRRTAAMPAGMVFSTRDNLPAFHFALDGFGYSKVHDIASSLRDFYGEDIEIYELDGFSCAWPRHVVKR